MLVDTCYADVIEEIKMKQFFDKENLKKAHEIILKEFGTVDILINGAGGNHPKGTTTKEYLEVEDLEKFMCERKN